MHASTLLPSLLLLSFSSISLAKPLPPRSTDGSQQDGSPVGVSAPEFTHPHAKELSDLAATLNDIAARIAVPPPDVLGSTEYQPSGEDDDDDYTDAAQDLGVGNLNGIEGLNGASLLPDNTFVPRRPSPTDKTENELQQTDRPHIKARHGADDDEGATQLLDGAELDELNSLPPDRTIAPRDPSPTDMHPGTEQTDRPHRMLAALKVRHGGEHHGAPAPGDALPASEESDEDDEDDDETEGYYDDDDEYDDADTDALAALSSALSDAPTHAAAPSKRQSGHEGHDHGASPLDASNPLPDLSGFPPTGGQGGETIPDPAAIASLGGSGGQTAKKARAAPGGLADGGAGLGNVGGLHGAEGVEGLGGRAARWAA
ncbi:hypothetical protein SLS56_003604 [Neofusicoccum ribis]|uniref:Uncharacterized protein n=1 Tax=Neofusicoccum ribis TaxID=45134 RepID=A0ABR3SYV1_9PEZI